MDAWKIAVIVLACVLFVYLAVMMIIVPSKTFFMALFSGVYIPAVKLVGMKLRKENYIDIVKAYITSRKGHLRISLYQLELIASSGGNPTSIVEGFNAAKSAGLKVSLNFAKAVDAAGMNFLQVVKDIVNPKVVEIPLITEIARDNQEINVKISLTLKTRLENFLSGVGLDTVTARAVEAVITKIANTDKAGNLVSKPQLLDKAIFDANIDDDSKYELVSADVIHIDFGVNKAFAVEKEQLERQRIISANQLEHRRLTALAVEQEMKAKAEEMRLKTIANEAEIPKAIVKAIEEGKMKDVIDYYKLENLQADTEMRRKLLNKK